MTVIPYGPRSAASSAHWRAEEMSQLLSIYAAHEAAGEASGWDLGETERREPQFYVLGHTADDDCVMTITRLDGDYVLEDGQGYVVAESASLSAIADQAVRMMPRRRRAAVLAQIGVAWVAIREFFEEKLEPLMAEPLEIATHFFPQLAAIA